MTYNKAQILTTDKNHIWHPFTQAKDFENIDPIIATRGEGIFLYDEAGNKLYDTMSSWWVNILGHCNPRINEAVKKQLDQLEHVNFSGFTHPFATELVEELHDIMPEGMRRYFFSDNGSTAIEAGIKMAFQYWVNKGIKGKNKFVMLNNSYHGDTLGATSVGAVDVFHKIYKPLMFDSFRVPAPYEYPYDREFTYDAMDQYAPESFEPMRKVLTENADEIAAVILEPILQGAGGLKVYHPEYLHDLRKCADENNILIICDEVATGFCRTGKMFAFQHAEGFVPDIFAVAKALTGGYLPLALTITSEKIYDAFYGDVMSTFFHGHSYTANPLACAAAKETIKILKEEKMPESRQYLFDYFQEKVRELAKYDFVGDIRYKGLIGGIELVESRKENKPLDPNKKIAFKIYQESFKHGLALRNLGNAIYWWLPMIVTKEDIDIIIERSITVIKKVLAENE